MNNPLRMFWFKHYWWITPLLIIVLFSLMVNFTKPNNVEGNVLALLGGGLGVIYFVQKQKLEELQLFERLFTRFNERYNALNESLQRALQSANTDIEVDPGRTAFVSYFNLCAEEYLFYSQGRILPSIWRAWCRGMMIYLCDPRVRQLWNREVASESYYGLHFEVIEAGARFA